MSLGMVNGRVGLDICGFIEYGFEQHVILHPGLDFRVVERKGLNGRILPQASERFAVFCGLGQGEDCLLYTSPSPRDLSTSRMPSSA